MRPIPRELLAMSFDLQPTGTSSDGLNAARHASSETTGNAEFMSNQKPVMPSLETL
jgi:hypothetical protein